MRGDTDRLQMAADWAQLSLDPSTQNGAVLYSESGVLIGKGWNRFPLGVETNEKRWARPAKYDYVMHAEAVAILDSLDSFTSHHRSTLYCTWAACPQCAGAIIESGIIRVVTLKSLRDKSSDEWADLIDIADEMLHEAGVAVHRLDVSLSRSLRFEEKMTEI